MNIDFFIKFFQEGGFYMYPIGFVMAVGVAIAIERFVFLSIAKASNKKAFEQMMPFIKKRDFDALIKMGNTSSAPISRIIAAGATRLKVTQDRDDISYAMEEGVMEITPRLEKRTGYLATLANLATLLGLLGTIIGLIDAFAAVATAAPAEKAALLSASISVAMNTTAFGLVAAIPLLIFYALLQSKTTEIVDSLEMAGVKFLNSLVD